MANTVNDVMNVIASPDYGIKNIAGTNQEILAILEGTHNSKNNIHAIVDDIRNLLRGLVAVATEKKPVEVGDASSVKVTHKYIQDLLDEAKGIRKAMINLEKEMKKQGGNTSVGVAKLTDKASQKVADAMIKDIENQKKGGGISAMVDAFNKLKDISLKDLIIGKQKIKYISNVFKNAKKDLNIDEKDLNCVIKLINEAPEMVKSLMKVDRKINRINKNETIKKLSEMLIGKNSLLSIAQILQKNEKIFNKVSKTAKDIEEFIFSLNKVVKKLVFTALWSKFADKGIQAIETTIDKLIPLSIKLTKNQKDIEKGAKSAKQVTVLVGNLLITSIFLTIAIVPALLGILGALALQVMVKTLMPAIIDLSENNKHLSKAMKSSLMLVACTGLLAISSIFLSTIAVTGIPALVGSLLMVGIVKLNVSTFKMLEKATKNVLIGSLVMILMSTSMLIFGIALGKITSATKDVSWEQFGMIVAFIGTFAAATAALGIPIVAGFVALGAVVLGTMGFALYTFAKALKMINDMGTIPRKQLDEVFGAMKATRDFFAKNSIGFGTVWTAMKYNTVMLCLGNTTRHLTKLKKLGEVPMGLVYGVLNAMTAIGKFYIDNPIDKDAIEQSYKYKLMMRPFGKTLKHLTKLKEMGDLPMGLVYGVLNAMSVIGKFYIDNPIDADAIWQSYKYKLMMRPFGKTLKYLTRLKEMGEIPMGLVYGVLNAMSVIGNYYKENEIERRTIKQARRYKRMMRPFSKTIKHLTRLKEMGEIPMGLVYGVLEAMSVIGNYYKENEIERKTIRQARRYKRMMRPFGKTIKYLSKLKEMGEIPMGLVHQALDAMGEISNYYMGQDIGFREAIRATFGAKIISTLISNFGESTKSLEPLKNLQSVPNKAIRSIVIALKDIAFYYNTAYFKGNIKIKTILSKYMVTNFAEMSKDMYEQIEGVKPIDFKTILSITFACRRIINFYNYQKVLATVEEVAFTNVVIKRFSEIVSKYLKKIKFTKSNYKSVNLAVDAMREIVWFLRTRSFGFFERERVMKTIIILNKMTSSLKDLSSLKQSDLSNVGDALTDIVDDVNSIDLRNVWAVTNMFLAFNSINRSKNVIDKFAKSVSKFTKVCANLIDTLNENTDAINNANGFSTNNPYTTSITNNNIIENGADKNMNPNNGIRIVNVDEIAKTIADQINGALSVDIPDTQVQLLINGMGGNEWTITRY
jgi:hypothetical protein